MTERIGTGLKITDLRENEPLKIEVMGKSYVIILHDRKINALDNECTHEKGPLNEGYIEGNEIICSWHSGAFNIFDGKANENTPWVTNTVHYEIEENQSGELELLI